ncbi:MAG TPA: hypothetical protein VIN59_08995 [Alphaproteobacteria bacterium]
MSSVPPVSTAPAPAPIAAGGTATGESTQAQVTNVPSSLSSTDRTLVLRGEVQQVNPQTSTVTIATPRGPVEVKLPEPLPAQSQRVEVTLQAGSPPTDASVRTVQQQPQPQVPQPNVPLPTTGNAPQLDPHLPAIPILQEQGQAPRPVNNAQTQGQVPTPGQQNTNAGAQANAGQASDVSPQGLLNFLKNSLQQVLKSPDGNMAQASNLLGAQKPLQIGQLVRLIPTPGQTPIVPQTATQQAAVIGNQPTPSLQAGLPMGQTPMAQPALQAPVLPQPQSAIANPTQTSAFFQTLQNAQVNLGGQTAPQISTLDRILLPLQNLLNTDMAPMIGRPSATVPTQASLAGLFKGIIANLTASANAGSVSAPSVQLPQTQAPMIDARMTATLPVIQHAAQNPGIANLLHGSPALPTLFAQVAGQTEQGLPVIQMPVFSGDAQPKMVMMTLQFPTKAMAPGTWVRMDVMQTGISMTSSMALPNSALTEWDSLDELFSTLRNQSQGQALVQMAQNAMPKPGAAAFTAPVLIFLAAARGGDVTAWMGERVTDSVRNIRRADILTRLTGAMSAATRQRDDTNASPTEWKTINLPMMGQEQHLSQIQMHYRSFDRDSETAQDSQRQKGARFVLDLSLTRIGPLQIDGLSVGKQLDVTLRSEQSFSPAMREALRLKYTDALGGIGFSGQLNFKADGDHKGWVDFRENDAAHTAARA